MTRFVFGAWLSPVERCVRVAEVPGSNPGAPIVEVPTGLVIRCLSAVGARYKWSSVPTGPVSDKRGSRGGALGLRPAIWSAGRMVLHSPRKRAPERAWGFESLALRFRPLGLRPRGLFCVRKE